ncbi:YciI family protein [Sporolactobacillus pectinivorans]|uniref:YciI family protein n=1 Tax=Sporolactobacillus pectinivorans TaxID=1591408 RepID=UPI000C2602EA|nr:YciI family protein [Sporolactobacillus pectinivorans]
MVIATLSYIKSIEDVTRALPQHNEYLDKYYSEKKFIFSGRKNPRTGGVILMNTSLDEAKTIAQTDPFYKHQIAQYEFIEFFPTKSDTGFSSFIN